MRLILMFGAFVAMSYGATAEVFPEDGYVVNSDSAPNIPDQLVKCWNLPSGVIGLELTAHFDVVLNNEGEVIDITSKEKKPMRSELEIFILSASRAIERCSPFNGVTAGTHEIIIAPIPTKKTINPFK